MCNRSIASESNKRNGGLSDCSDGEVTVRDTLCCMTEDEFLRLLELEFGNIRESQWGRLHAEVQRVDADAARTRSMSSSSRLVGVRNAFTECAGNIATDFLAFRERLLRDHPSLQNQRTRTAFESLLNDEYQRLYSGLEDRLRRTQVWNPTMGHRYSLNVAVLLDNMRKELEKSDLLSRPSLPPAAQPSPTVQEIHALLDQFQFSTTKGHLDQGIAAHSRGDWAAANAQFRAFVESMFDEIARHLGCPATMPRAPSDAPGSLRGLRPFLTKA